MIIDTFMAGVNKQALRFIVLVVAEMIRRFDRCNNSSCARLSAKYVGLVSQCHLGHTAHT